MISMLVDFVDRFLNDLSATQFGALTAQLGTTGALLATLAALLVAFNMLMQFHYLDTGESLKLIVKIGIIAWLFRDWENFNAVASGILSLLDTTGAALIASVNASDDAAPATMASIPAAMDSLLVSLGTYGAEIAGNLGIFGGPIFGFGVVILVAILGAGTVVIICLAKIAMAALIGLAPVALILTFFDATKPWFERWVSSIITFALYPVIIAAVFSTILGMINLFIMELTEARDISSVGEATGMFLVIILSIVLVPAIPMIAMMLSGNITARLPGLRGLGNLARGAATAAAVSTVAASTRSSTTGNTPNPPSPGGLGGGGGAAKPAMSSQTATAIRIAERQKRYEQRHRT